MVNYRIQMWFTDENGLIYRESPAIEENYQGALNTATLLVSGYCEAYGWNFVMLNVEIQHGKK